ncbi:MAG TPA: tetratricopeptide repeat protein [Bryobacteraceae bacterium]|jgi:tetratricopeptide (TPR) repeat protein|nr:tetratricopeptide repeat protein [Bryobacteraceae bacterium]
MRTGLFYGSLIFLPFLVLASPADPGNFEQLLTEAHVALTKSDLVAARASLDEACPARPVPATSPRSALCETEAGAIDEAAGQTQNAEAHYRRAIPMWEQLGPDFSTFYATALMDLGNLYQARHRPHEAEAALTRALAHAGEHDPVRAVIATRLGSFYSESSTPERGRPLLNEAIAMLRARAASKPAEMARACNALGMIDVRAGTYKTGETNLREAVSIAEHSLGESHPDTALYEGNLALALYLEGEYARAEVLLRRARHIIETSLPPESPRLGNVLASLTVVETAQGEFIRAETDGKQSLAILTRLREPDSPEIAVQQVTLGALYLKEKKIDDAAALLPGAVAVERLLSDDSRLPDRRVLADGIRRLGELKALQRDWTGARTLYAEAVSIYESTLGPAHPAIAPVLLEYAGVLKHCNTPGAQVKDIEARARAMKL